MQKQCSIAPQRKAAAAKFLPMPRADEHENARDREGYALLHYINCPMMRQTPSATRASAGSLGFREDISARNSGPFPVMEKPTRRRKIGRDR